MPQSAHWGDRVIAASQAKGSVVCVGLDPTLEQLPEPMLRSSAGAYGSTAKGAADAIAQFSRAVIDGVAGTAVAVKPQSAFYEVYGAPGVAAFWDTVSYARSKGLLVVGDAKRGDIGSTAEAYARAFFGSATPLASWLDPDQQVDCLTINAYLGSDGVLPFLKDAGRGKGVFVLVKTSNPSSGELQDLQLTTGRSVAEQMALMVDQIGRQYLGQSGYSAVGAVVGATYPQDLARLRAQLPHAIILVPGYGAQGGTAADVVHALDAAGTGALVTASRSIIYAFRQLHGSAATPAQVTEAAGTAAAQMREQIRTALANRI